MVSGSSDELLRAVRSVLRTRAAAPHLPSAADPYLLIADAPLLEMGLSTFISVPSARRIDCPVGSWSQGPIPERRSNPRRIHCLCSSARAPQPSSSNGVPPTWPTSPQRLPGSPTSCGWRPPRRRWPSQSPVRPADSSRRACGAGWRSRRTASSSRSIHVQRAARSPHDSRPRTHGSSLRRSSDRRGDLRQSRDGLWLLERRIRTGASVWIFDDAPLAQVDEVGAEALTITLRALLRRRPADTRSPSRERETVEGHGTGRFGETLLAVARANGRIAPAARALGVHRNTVLYRLRAVRAQGGPDPRLPEDALRILQEARPER